MCAAEEKNFTRAAERLYMSQQTLSNHIRRLEDSLGVLLFERRPHLKLTLAGERMILHAKNIQNAKQNLEMDFADLSANQRNKLTVGITRTRAVAFMPFIMARYCPHYPNISISLLDTLSYKMQKHLIDGVIDLYIGIDASTSQLMETHPLDKERQYCLLNKLLLAQYFPGNWHNILIGCHGEVDLPTLLALAKMPFIMLSPGNRMRIALDFLLHQHGIIPNCVFETLDQYLTMKLASSGYGVGFVSQAFFYAFHEQIKACPDLLAMPVLIDSMDMTVNLVTLPNVSRPRYFQDFIETAKSFFRDYTDEVAAIALTNKQSCLLV